MKKSPSSKLGVISEGFGETDRQGAPTVCSAPPRPLHPCGARLTPLSAPTASLNDIVVKEFHDAVNKQPDMAVAVAAIKALTSVIKNSSAQTMMGLQVELKEAAAALQK